LKSAGTVKIRGFDTFSKCKSREGGYRVSYGSSPVEDVYTGFTYVKFKAIASFISKQWGERIQHFKAFGLLRDS